MPNLYGVAAPNPLPIIIGGTIGGADIVVSTSAETTFATNTLPPVLGNGNYYPFVIGCICITNGATSPTFCNWAFKFGTGSDLFTQASPAFVWNAGASWEMNVYMYSYNTLFQNPIAPTVINVCANISSVGSLTIHNIGTWVTGGWLRAPD